MLSFDLNYYFDRTSTYAKYNEIRAYCAQSLKYYNYCEYYHTYVRHPVLRTANGNRATVQSTILFLALNDVDYGTLFIR